MPVHIGEFDVSSPPAAPPAAPVQGAAEPADVMPAPAQAQRLEQQRRERALRLFAH
ncbi:hypothetical protein [Massilia sp. S19_KUP03_FR1]|uniref:hypothetical protein n=1 Tax=Massilia sp. S19_KUP03_FR1 TaxID=3025503 RepID=UPI002FCD8031